MLLRDLIPAGSACFLRPRAERLEQTKIAHSHATGDAGPERGTGVNGSPRRNTAAHPDPQAYPDANANSNAGTDFHADSNSNLWYASAHGNAKLYIDSLCDADTAGDVHSIAHVADCYAGSNIHAISYRNSDRDGHCNFASSSDTCRASNCATTDRNEKWSSADPAANVGASSEHRDPSRATDRDTNSSGSLPLV